MKKKILVLASNPKGTSNVDVMPEIRNLQQALQRPLNRERFSVEWKVAEATTELDQLKVGRDNAIFLLQSAITAKARRELRR